MSFVRQPANGHNIDKFCFRFTIAASITNAGFEVFETLNLYSKRI